MQGWEEAGVWCVGWWGHAVQLEHKFKAGPSERSGLKVWQRQTAEVLACVLQAVGSVERF